MSEKTKEPRGLSGIYFRFRNPETNEMENRVFEDLPESEQDRILFSKEPEFVRNLAKLLAKKLYAIGEQFDIITG